VAKNGEPESPAPTVGDFGCGRPGEKPNLGLASGKRVGLATKRRETQGPPTTDGKGV